MSENLSKQQRLQEAQYSFPYHYIPWESSLGFTQSFSWSWGMHYLAGLQVVLHELKNLSFSSLLDVGCGDGRFLREVSLEFPQKYIVGIDYSESAISLARALNPSIDYRCLDITKDEPKEKFDVVTLVEVLEHIPLEYAPLFLRSVSGILSENGILLLTVPHVNKTLQDKHYQHFSVESLNDILSTNFDVKKIIPFDRRSRLTGWLLKSLGYTSNQYLVTNRSLNKLLYEKVLYDCLHEQPEHRCCRLLAVASQKI